MAFCPHCMTVTEAPVCPTCRKPVAYTPKPWELPVGASPDGNGRYQVGAALGQGGFGITYIGIDNRTHQRVAVKEYFPTMCAQRNGDHTAAPQPGMEKVYAGGRKHFLEEGQMLYSVRGNPSVVRVQDCFEANGTAYIVMEYLQGLTLEQKLDRDGEIPLYELLPWLYTMVNDIAKLHTAGVLHRDISPDNIMWLPGGTLKLMDFGSAKSMEDGKSMTVMLKHGFAPVEQYMRHGQGPWTDVYALCATVYYCMTGKVPPMSPERLEEDTLIPPSKLGVKLTEQQEQALLWGLTVQPQMRPQDMGAFGREFFKGWRPMIADPPKPDIPNIPKSKEEQPMQSTPSVWQKLCAFCSAGKKRLQAYCATKIGGAVMRIVLTLLALVLLALLLSLL